MCALMPTLYMCSSVTSIEAAAVADSMMRPVCKVVRRGQGITLKREPLCINSQMMAGRGCMQNPAYTQAQLSAMQRHLLCRDLCVQAGRYQKPSAASCAESCHKAVAYGTM